MFPLQPTHLSNDSVQLVPLQATDFERLYAVASDPLVWEQHPNKNRYQREVFQNYFEGAIASNGAFILIEIATEKVIGCTRFYDTTENSVAIGYTFFARSAWGSAFNPGVKKLMLDYSFGFVDTVIFHVGSKNLRSQIAVGRLGAVKIREIDVAYHGEPETLNYEYALTKASWNAIDALR